MRRGEGEGPSCREPSDEAMLKARGFARQRTRPADQASEPEKSLLSAQIIGLASEGAALLRP